MEIDNIVERVKDFLLPSIDGIRALVKAIQTYLTGSHSPHGSFFRFSLGRNEATLKISMTLLFYFIYSDCEVGMWFSNNDQQNSIK